MYGILVVITNVLQLINEINNLLVMPTQTANLVVLGYSLVVLQF